MERKLTPIDRVRNPQVAVDLKLPGYINPHNIGIDEERILDVVETMAVDALHISGDWTGRDTQFTLGIGVKGASPRKVTKSQPMKSGQIERAYAPRIFFEGRSIPGFSLTIIAANIDLTNIPEMINKEGALWEHEVRSEQAWAYHMNKKLEGKMLKLSMVHLFQKIPSDIVFSRSFFPLVRPFSLPSVVTQIFASPLVEVI